MSKESKLSLTVPEDEDISYDDSQIDEQTSEYADRKRVPFSTTLNAGLYEKLKAIHFYDDIMISDIVNRAIHLAVEQLEERRGEAYDVPGPLQIDENNGS
ncbi:MAG: hypothetical protein ABEL04_08615 [Salinibacter sp.]|uniref:hypothetical protein n=1 Tax=Salinibacter sp. TaxID=2065818 RepID=UPI0035D50E31